MRRISTLGRIGGIVMAAALIGAGSLAGPAQAAKKCGAYKPAEPQSDSLSRTDAPKAKVVKITEKFTADKPYLVEFDHGPAHWLITDPSGSGPQGQASVVEDTKWFNIQVDSKAKSALVNVRLQWLEGPQSDIDLYIWDRYGIEVARSADFNQVDGTPLNSTGGWGFEQVSDLAVADCTGLTIESRAFWTVGEAMQLTVWLS